MLKMRKQQLEWGQTSSANNGVIKANKAFKEKYLSIIKKIRSFIENLRILTL